MIRLLVLAGVAALLLRGAGRKRKPQLVITSWLESELPSGWARSAKRAGFDAVSKKVLHGSDPFRPGEAGRVLRAGDSAGLDRHGWGWHYLRDPLEAVEEGQAAGQMSRALGLRAYWVNAEKHWAGVEGQPPTENPPRELQIFADSFRSVAPRVLLIFNGFSWPRTSDGRPLLTPEALGAFDAFGPMVYGTTRATIAKKYRARSKRASAVGVGFAPMVGTGRVDSLGRVWGFAESGPGGSGLLDLVREDPPDFLAFWYGAGSADMLTEGSTANPPLATVARAIRART